MRFSGAFARQESTIAYRLKREVDRVEWFPIDGAIASASYPQEKTIIRKAKELIVKDGEVS